MNHTFDVISEESLSSPKSQIFSPINFSRSFMFRISLVYYPFWVNFSNGMRYGLKFFCYYFWGFFVYRHLIVPVSFVVKTILSPLNHLSVLLKINYYIYVSLFLDSLFWSMICLSFAMPILYCLDNCSFIVSIISNK